VTTWPELVAAIRLDPEDEAPRRAAAAWLKKQGDPRATFILKGRASPEQLASWRAPIEALGAQSRVRDTTLGFDRGFVIGITLVGRSGANFAAICALEPIVSLTVVSSGARVFAELAALPELAQVRSLCITGNHTDGHEALVASPHLTGLRALEHPFNTLAKVDALAPEARERGRTNLARAYAASASAGTLYLSRCDDDMVARVAAYPLTGLRALALRECNVGAPAYAARGGGPPPPDSIQ
jgi:uncharacterized protein (TIGR02996 family)